MATLTELIRIVAFEVEGAIDLQRKVQAAMQVTAALILDNGDTNPPFGQGAGQHTQRVKWANLVLESDSETRKMFKAAIGYDPAATQAQILGASDATIQTTVDALVDEFAAIL